MCYLPVSAVSRRQLTADTGEGGMPESA